MKATWKQFLFALLLPLAVGTLASFLTADSMLTFSRLNQPPFSPPAWLFPVVWTILYLLMGLASYLVYRSNQTELIPAALTAYGLQLAFNFLWSIFFFRFDFYLFSFFWLIALWLLILLTYFLFSRIQKTAGILLIPYLIWVAFAGYLNLGIAILN